MSGLLSDTFLIMFLLNKVVILDKYINPYFELIVLNRFSTHGSLVVLKMTRIVYFVAERCPTRQARLHTGITWPALGLHDVLEPAQLSQEDRDNFSGTQIFILFK